MAIKNAHHPESVIAKMESSTIDFYLTGSRFFGGANPGSDWDYFARDSRTAREFLSSLGFYPVIDIDMAIYDDSTIVSVYERNDVQVQLVKDAILKNSAQQFLAENCNMRAIPKESRKHLWNLAIRMVQLALARS
jgi:hypothetical protein